MSWFDRHKRDLPWRPAPTTCPASFGGESEGRSRGRTHDPYRIWLAEIMLQQTRVPVVIPYYRRFLRTFPTVGRLAAARRERVLALWAGLGYYQRARNLHRAAQQIVSEHGGRFPKSLEAALRLPGVGAYTARAVLSIAYGQPLAVVDGNVARVLARVFRLPAPTLSGRLSTRARLQPLADRLVSPRRPGDFNQALMELGSTLCLPKVPRCPSCPLESLCAARRAGIERAWPPRVKQRQRPRRRLAVLLLRHRGRPDGRPSGRLLLAQEDRGLFSGLWHFPYARLGRRATLPPQLRACLRRQRAELLAPRPLFRLNHPMTAGNLDLHVFLASAPHARAETHARWISPRWIRRMAVGAATRKILAATHPGG